MRGAADAGVEVERPGRKEQSRTADGRSRCGTYSVDAVRRGELVEKAMLTVEKPWWTTEW